MRLVAFLLLNFTVLLIHCDEEITHTVHTARFLLIASGKKLRGCTLEAASDVNIMKCAALCSRTEYCRSFNHYRTHAQPDEQMICELNSVFVTDLAYLTDTNDDNWRYYGEY